MAATDGQIILAASRFGDATPTYLREFSKTHLPAIAKIIKGQHQTLGVPTLSNPSLQSTALFLNAGKKYQILAQPVKIKEGRKSTNIGSKILIPETYPGYFELLSEDGRSARCIDSVLELSKRRNIRVLVRETFRCHHNNKTIHAGEILTTLNESGKYLQCRTLKDEIVNLPLEAKVKFSPIAKEDSISGVHCVKNLLQKRMPVIARLVHGTAPKGLKTPFVPEMRLLGCIEVDRVFALPLQKDTDLIAVPLNAKLKLQRAKNMEQLENFIEYSRFLDKANRLLTDARDRLQIVDIKLSDKDGKKDTASSKSNSSNNNNNSNSNRNKILAIPLAGFENGYMLKKSTSCDSTKHLQETNYNTIADEYDEIDQIYDYVRGFAPLPKNLNKFEPIPVPHSNNNNNSINSNNNSINNNTKSSDISSLKSPNDNNGNYSSLLKNNIINSSLESIKLGNHHVHHHTHHIHYTHNNHHAEEIKPIPPPIETIPGKKLPEKRQRPTLPKLYVKNGNHQKNSAILINNCTPNNNLLTNGAGKDALEPQSPLFHIRYKSLSSLQLTPDSNPTTPVTPTIVPLKPLDKNLNNLSKSASAGGGREGTLDSSRSGGRTSGDSKLPEKKTRRLSRPRSLSNLVWDFRPQKEKTKKKLYVHQYDQRQQGTLYL